MTLNGVITVLRYFTKSPASEAFVADYLKLVEVRPIYCLQEECSPVNVVLVIFAEITEKHCVKEMHPREKR